MKNLIITIVVVLSLVGIVRYAFWCCRADNGIHTIAGSKNVVLIEGSCVTINWDASEAEWDAAKAKWMEVK